MEVTKQEYLDHIKNYPHPLTTVMCEICGPPLKSHTYEGKAIATVELDCISDEGEIVDDDSYYKYYIRK